MAEKKAGVARYTGVRPGMPDDCEGGGLRGFNKGNDGEPG